MIASTRENELCHYYYDALDRLAESVPSTFDGLQLFYCAARLTTEVRDGAQCSIFQDRDQLLAQREYKNEKAETRLLATDHQRSIMNTHGVESDSITYMPYGHRTSNNGLLGLLGFNGERPDPLTGHYHLGNGYRQFNTALMRFNSPDSWSPFGDGGLNAYAYCVGDPVNRSDPTGHRGSLLGALAIFRPQLRPTLKAVGRLTLGASILSGTVGGIMQFATDKSEGSSTVLFILAGALSAIGTGALITRSLLPSKLAVNTGVEMTPTLSHSSPLSRPRLPNTTSSTSRSSQRSESTLPTPGRRTSLPGYDDAISPPPNYWAEMAVRPMRPAMQMTIHENRIRQQGLTN